MQRLFRDFHNAFFFCNLKGCMDLKQNFCEFRKHKTGGFFLCTYKLTINGWFISDKIFFSFFTCSTCFSLITSAIAKIFIAQNVCVVLSRQRQTRPNVPVPGNNKNQNIIGWLLKLNIFINYHHLSYYNIFALNDSTKYIKTIARIYSHNFHLGN